MNTKINVELNDKQQAQYDKWLDALKTIYGQVGNLTWKISYTGIGAVIKVYSELANIELDLTDVDSW
jgi:hypothetical protein